MTAPLFEAVDGGFAAQPLTRGPWDPAAMHGGAPAALIAREVERIEAAASMVVARLTIDFLRAVPLGEVAVDATVVKPGRRLQLVEATLGAGGPRLCLARAVRLRRDLVSDAAASPARGADPLPATGRGEHYTGLVESDDEMFCPDAVEIRLASGELGSGAVAAWVRLRGDVVAGERPSPLMRVAAAADFANGLSWMLPVDDWLFVNTDLSISLHREPAGEWIGVDARTSIGDAGVGVASATLHDERGPVGVSAQSLLVERR